MIVLVNIVALVLLLVSAVMFCVMASWQHSRTVFDAVRVLKVHF